MTTVQDVINPAALDGLLRGLTPLPKYQPPSAEFQEKKRLRNLYGRHYRILRWEERTPDSQREIEKALAAFQRWRRLEGDETPDNELWNVPAPHPDTLEYYLGSVSYRCRQWRDRTVAALRLYFLHIEEPALFRKVEVKLVRD